MRLSGEPDMLYVQENQKNFQEPSFENKFVLKKVNILHKTYRHKLLRMKNGNLSV